MDFAQETKEREDLFNFLRQEDALLKYLDSILQKRITLYVLKNCSQDDLAMIADELKMPIGEKILFKNFTSRQLGGVSREQQIPALEGFKDKILEQYPLGNFLDEFQLLNRE